MMKEEQGEIRQKYTDDHDQPLITNDVVKRFVRLSWTYGQERKRWCWKQRRGSKRRPWRTSFCGVVIVFKNRFGWKRRCKQIRQEIIVRHLEQREDEEERDKRIAVLVVGKDDPLECNITATFLTCTQVSENGVTK